MLFLPAVGSSISDATLAEGGWRMAKRAITQSLYDKLVDGFRDKPGNYRSAAMRAGVDQRTSKRAWLWGWPTKPWAIPIKQYLEQEKEQIRIARQRAVEERAIADEDSRAKIRQDAIDAQTQEALAAKAGRVNAIALANMISKLMPALIGVSERLATEIKNGAHTFNPTQAAKLMQTASFVVRQANEAIRLAIEIERLRVGDPTDVFKITTDETDPDEAVSTLMGMVRTLRRARKDPMSLENEGLIEGANGRYPDPQDAVH